MLLCSSPQLPKLCLFALISTLYGYFGFAIVMLITTLQIYHKSQEVYWMSIKMVKHNYLHQLIYQLLFCLIN